MDFFQKNKTKMVIGFLILLSLSFIKCANEAHRHGLLPGVQLGQGSPMDGVDTPQVTTITDIIDNSTPSQSHVAKEIFIKQTMHRVLDEALPIIESDITELPWEATEEFFTELGTNPHEAFSVGNRVHVHSRQSVNGIRYLNAGFNVISSAENASSIDEVYLAFEVERFEGNFETTIDFLREGFLGENAEPCMDTMQDHVFFKKGDWIVEVFKETEDSIDLYSVYPPRTLEDVGVVRVSLSSGGHYHNLEGSCLPESAHDHAHGLPGGAHEEGPR